MLDAGVSLKTLWFVAFDIYVIGSASLPYTFQFCPTKVYKHRDTRVLVVLVVYKTELWGRQTSSKENSIQEVLAGIQSLTILRTK